MDGTRFGETMKLVGYSVNEERQSSDNIVKLELFWQADQPAERGWKMFVHVLDSDGRIALQEDRYPYRGVYPTDRWMPGQIVDESFIFALSDENPAGTYRIAVGMYDEASGARIQVRDIDGKRIADDRYSLPYEIFID
jgi:hypothetical protein